MRILCIGGLGALTPHRRSLSVAAAWSTYVLTVGEVALRALFQGGHSRGSTRHQGSNSTQAVACGVFVRSVCGTHCSSIIYALYFKSRCCVHFHVSAV